MKQNKAAITPLTKKLAMLFDQDNAAVSIMIAEGERKLEGQNNKGKGYLTKAIPLSFAQQFRAQKARVIFAREKALRESTTQSIDEYALEMAELAVKREYLHSIFIDRDKKRKQGSKRKPDEFAKFFELAAKSVFDIEKSLKKVSEQKVIFKLHEMKEKNHNGIESIVKFIDRKKRQVTLKAKSSKPTPIKHRLFRWKQKQVAQT